MTTPKKLADLRYQDNVIEIRKSDAPDTHARRWFNELFDTTEEPVCRKIFSEDRKNVYECYIDSGSVDYLYIIQG